MTDALAIEVCNVSKTFKSARALKQVNLHVAPGERVALIGPSGSGKSTLLRHLSGLIPSDRNARSIAVLGQTVQESGVITRQIRHVRADVGVIFQRMPLLVVWRYGFPRM